MTTIIKSVTAIAIAFGVGCATAPKTSEERASLESDAMEVVSEMQAQSPGLRQVIDQAAGYAVFPSVGKGGLIVGGAHGRGVLFEGGRAVGYVQINEASLGLTAGGQSFSELIVFHDRESLNDVKRDDFELGADASVIALTEGAGASAQPLEAGVSVYVLPRGGLMADVSLGGQRIDFEPRG
jgi:lipid-binding SYLF domain-containing protein